MKIRFLLALFLAGASAPALAQQLPFTPGSPAPGVGQNIFDQGMGKLTPCAFADTNNKALPCSLANPLPVVMTGSLTLNSPAIQPVSGNISILNFPSSQAVTGTFWQAIQPISGTVNVGNFPASQAVTGNFYQSTQPVSLASIPLGSNASTATNQTTGNTSLASIDNKLSGVLNVQGGLTSSSWAFTQFLAGKCFTFAIPLTSVSAGNDLNIVLNNPVGSGETFVVLERRFSQITTNVLLYSFYPNPAAITGTVKAGTNELDSSSNTSQLSMTYAIQAATLTGTSTGSMPIPPNGVENTPITFQRTISPGSRIGYTMSGTGGFLTAASSFTFTLQGCKM